MYGWAVAAAGAAISVPPWGRSADPGERKASQARTQGAPICRHIGATEDAAWRCFAAARVVLCSRGGALVSLPAADGQPLHERQHEDADEDHGAGGGGHAEVEALERLA